jgi:hypothetical protein
MVFRQGLAVGAFIAVAAGATVAVVAKARRDAADPARCAGLAPMENRCCAAGQALRGALCVGRPTRCPPPLLVSELGCIVRQSRIFVAGGVLHAGAGDWEAEGRIRTHDAAIASFELDAFEITEGAYAECVAAGRCLSVPLSGEPGRALGGLTRGDAEAYCLFRGGKLPTEDEWTFAAGGAKSRRYPWGDAGAVCRRGAWGLRDGPCGFDFTGPELAGAHPDGASPEGIYDLAGNVAEWVAGNPGDREGAVRGGSFASGLATELRTWHARRVSSDTRSVAIGARCAYVPAGLVPTSVSPPDSGTTPVIP